MKFDLPKENASIIKVIGVGGGGSNAVNHMYSQGIKDVDFIVCNTDNQALDISPVPNKVQLGLTLTQGLGAGSLPEIGGDAALYFDPTNPDSLEKVASELINSQSLRQSLKEKGYSRLKEFSWDKTFQDHLNVYKSII